MWSQSPYKKNECEQRLRAMGDAEVSIVDQSNESMGPRALADYDWRDERIGWATSEVFKWLFKDRYD